MFRRRLEWFRWTGMIFVIGGLVTVGTTDILYPDHHNKTNVQPSPEFNVSTQSNEFNYGNLMLGSLGMGSDEHTPAQLLLGDIMIVCAQVNISNLYSVGNMIEFIMIGFITSFTYVFITFRLLLLPRWFMRRNLSQSTMFQH